jgi:hypothetical protein
MEPEKKEDQFVPKGAIAFFVIMMAFYLVLWFLFYFLMLGRR